MLRAGAGPRIQKISIVRLLLLPDHLTPGLPRPLDLGDFLVGDHYFFRIETFAEIWLEVLTGRLEKKTIPARLVNLQIKPVDQLGAPFIDGVADVVAGSDFRDARDDVAVNEAVKPQ